MVLLAASVFSKAGKRLLVRCFVDNFTKARLEGLLDAFPKLVINDKNSDIPIDDLQTLGQRQHNFVETDSVRYVFHPIDNIYVVLLTTKASNILEDLETLRTFSRLIPEYCRSNDEKEIFDHVFDLIHAFDEAVTLGYRESVNLAQIRTFTEMDSHEERVFLQIQEAQMKAAKDAMKEKAKELKRQQKEALTRGLKGTGSNFGSSMSGGSAGSFNSPRADTEPAPISKPAPTRPSGGGGGKALKLGAKNRNEDEFLSTLQKQGQAIAPVDRPSTVSASVAPVATVKREAVHVRAEEKLSASVSRDGGLQSAELAGSLSLSVSAPQFQTVAIQMRNNAPAGVQLQSHPHLKKEDWQNSALLRLKSAGKPFPVNQDVGVLKWRMTLTDEEQLPIALNCWPQESADGCQVNIEYTLQREDLALENVAITVPLPPATAPVVSECEGQYDYQKSRNQILWTLPLIDSSNSTGTLEFTVPNGHSDHFFPVSVRFNSERLFADISVEGAQMMDSGEAVPYSSESRFVAEKYEVV